MSDTVKKMIVFTEIEVVCEHNSLEVEPEKWDTAMSQIEGAIQHAAKRSMEGELAKLSPFGRVAHTHLFIITK